MRSSAQARNRIPASARSGSTASLSVVVVSSGPAVQAQRIAQVLNGAARDFGAQIILVSQESEASLKPAFDRPDAEFILAPAGSTRAEMCDLGMSRASGSIVAVRDALEVADARWLDAYRNIVPMRDDAAPVTVVAETVVMDSLVAAKRSLADAASAAFGGLDVRSPIAAIEMAAAV